jgi:hypothetical protein
MRNFLAGPGLVFQEQFFESLHAAGRVLNRLEKNGWAAQDQK